MNWYLTIITAIVSCSAFWQLFGDFILKLFNRKSAVGKQLDAIEQRLDKHIQADEEETMRNHRARILRFSEEECKGVEHTKEHWEDVLESIDAYNKYCVEHPKFPNSKAVLAIEAIKNGYEQHLENNDFFS